MDKDIFIRKNGYAGHITLNRPEVLNSLTYQMILSIEDALDEWANDKNVSLVVIDALGDRAFCAGGDIQILYENGSKGNFQYGQKFWADEYRLNEKIFKYKKPFFAFMQGFTMGGGVGVSCHGSHRIVGETSQIAMPECSIGLVPDVGGSYLLAKLDGNLGIFLGATGKRMKAGDAIFCNFADFFIPEAKWVETKSVLFETGKVASIEQFVSKTPPSKIKENKNIIYDAMTDVGIYTIESCLQNPLFEKELKNFKSNSPLAVAYTITMLKDQSVSRKISNALDKEYQYTARSQEFGDFQEGIRAAVIDKDRNPKWKHANIKEVTQEDLDLFLKPMSRKKMED